MTIGHDLEHRLDSWMQEDATLPDDLREVLAKLPETPQRRHRWSPTFADLKWRTRTMFSATRVAAFVAIFALGGSLAIYGGALTPTTDQAAVPSASSATAEDPAQSPSYSSSRWGLPWSDLESPNPTTSPACGARSPGMSPPLPTIRVSWARGGSSSTPPTTAGLGRSGGHSAWRTRKARGRAP